MIPTLTHRCGAFLFPIVLGMALVHVPALAQRTGTAPAPTVLQSDSSQAAASEIVIQVGHQAVIRASAGLTRVAVGDPTVADATPIRQGTEGASIIVIGKAPGSTDILVWDGVRAQPTSYSIIVRRAGAVSHSARGTAINSTGSGTLISGMTTSLEDHGRVVDAASDASGKGGLVVDESVVNVGRTVQVDVKVVEFSKSVLKEAGFNLFTNRGGFAFGTFAPSSLASTGLPPAGTQGGVNFVTQSPIGQAFNLVAGYGRGILGNLSILETNGLARVLAEPSLVALSGQSAKFLAGGEIPIPVPQSFGNVTIEYKPFGIGLTVSPTVLSEHRIALKVAPEASDLDYSNAVTLNGISVPAITTRRADTMVELGDGESFVIGGLVSRSTVSNLSKVPVLGDLPILGTFFKSMSYTQTEKELVIIVTPHIISPIAKGAALPQTPGEAREQHDASAWQSYVFGSTSADALPGFSK